MSKILVIFDSSNFYHRSKKVAPQVHLTKFHYRKLAEALTGTKEIDIEYCVGEIKRERNNPKSTQMYNGQMSLFYVLREQNIVIKKAS
ncbi:MAG: hypothetical protein A3C85_02935 [Candidatus Doudnabacteria bacterium RIFCSPHIGHO2_02_FULL_48_21]|uniref:NYN domain-containing protein n=1 Tax=Candidatus Doudnabacteria bacterium RIFCSPLOWO2_02_FULL_48_13 TaxID=1817845 RepID=A0A1F5QBX0_9BACT|nr:MAG: hypothetical protein A3K05_00195 [Candidatus Doudnabacteria bacterium RIFCSPHIGHO2_01_48_18]OGE79463.1 MAG: hypothetical protein A2668_02110 [Candidatus Doudnabacteria bacterium RIFCSPHIGHO2_01_FULL_48_180]OGE93219.1 MAG: hypothetical protein A3C85_02935 [Candidatus Doudnabacteria bacterium RIFCSPHIGHO2_02_FULL_48_21]OGE97908.1 MAG: hypothetical protein A3A83_03085 [Candidatus Doudnabacteria bacterium RIFCSPLOWO2_01_FULL_48_57]OGE99701.1 MAG: hypothetical protein A3J05_01695 [Candidatus